MITGNSQVSFQVNYLGSCVLFFCQSYSVKNVYFLFATVTCSLTYFGENQLYMLMDVEINRNITIRQ